MDARNVARRTEQAQSRIGSKAGVDLHLRNFHKGVVTIKYFREPAACPIQTGAVGPPQAEKEMIMEVLEEQLKRKIPEIERIVIE